MKSLVLNPEYGLYERQGQPFCSSRQVAETFEKEHKHVLQSVRDAVETTKNFAAEFSATNFIEVKYRERGRMYPEFLLTKDGFSFVVMGFTGEKAAEFKVAYIERFRQMESFIKSLLAAKLEHPAFTEAVLMAHEEPKHYHFSNEADMINRLVLGVPAKVFREQHGIEAGKSIRPYLSHDQIRAVELLQRADIGLLAVGTPFEARKIALQGYLLRWQARKAIAAA